MDTELLPIDKAKKRKLPEHLCTAGFMKPSGDINKN